MDTKVRPRFPSRWFAVPVVLGGLLLSPATLWALDKEDKEEQKEEEKKPENLLESVEMIKTLMAKVEELLAALKTGRGTQDEQRKIIDELNRLIEEAQAHDG